MAKFVDAQMMQQKHPDTFGAPSREELDQIKPGDFVKVCSSRERFWVKVTTVDAEAITGTVDNEPVLDGHGLKADDQIRFEKRHVYDIFEMKKTT